MIIQIELPGYASFTNTDTDSTDTTDDPYVFIRSIRNGSLIACTGPGTVRIVTARSKYPPPSFEKFQDSGADGKTVYFFCSIPQP